MTRHRAFAAVLLLNAACLTFVGCCAKRPINPPVCTCVLDHPDYYDRHMADPSFQYDAPEDCLAHGKDAE